MFVLAAVFGACLVVFVCGTHFTPVIETLNFPLNFNATENSLCKSDVELFAKSLKNNTLWAYRMWDSTAKLPLGLTEGSQYQMGNFDECLSIKEPFATQYCLAKININITVEKTVDTFALEYKPYMNLYEKIDYTNDPNQRPRDEIFWGLCVPASCNIQDIQEELQLYLNKGHDSHIVEFKVELNQNDCQDDHTGYGFTYSDYLFCFVIGAFIIIVGIGTIYDFKYINDKNENDINGKSVKVLMCFSAKQNYIELFKLDCSNKRTRIFYGAKFILMYTLIFGHSVNLMMTGSIFNFSYTEQLNRSMFWMLIIRGEVIVDVFFFMSGLLNTYCFLEQSEKNNFSPLRSIVLRYFRLVPVFGVISFFYSTLFYKMGSGPLWPKIVGVEKEYCDKNWWTNVLFINNYIDIDNMCLLQGWFIGAEFQMFLVSIPLNYLIKRNNKISWTIFASFYFAALSVPFSLVYFAGQEPIYYSFNIFFYYLRHIENFQKVYVPGHARICTYILGMILGFVYFKLRDSKLKIKFVPSVIIMTAASILACFCIFIGVYLYNPYLPHNPLKDALYTSLHRSTFVFAGGIICFVLSFGSIQLCLAPMRLQKYPFTKLLIIGCGTLLLQISALAIYSLSSNNVSAAHILTWTPMIPLSKLAFSAYLTHFIFQLGRAGSQRTPTNFTFYYWGCQSIVETTLSIGLGFVLYILIENPCIRFVKEIIPKQFSSKRNIKSESTENVVQS